MSRRSRNRRLREEKARKEERELRRAGILIRRVRKRKGEDK